MKTLWEGDGSKGQKVFMPPRTALQETIASHASSHIELAHFQEYPESFGRSIFEWWYHNKQHLRHTGHHWPVLNSLGVFE